jgi:hypothetical protein
VCAAGADAGVRTWRVHTDVRTLVLPFILGSHDIIENKLAVKVFLRNKTGGGEFPHQISLRSKGSS